MRIPVMAGVGRGQTTVSAHDAALNDCGVLDYNLIPGGAVIPPGTTIVESDRAGAPARAYGDRLYVVMAERRSDVAGQAIAAGIGWFQWDDGRGVFVEHEAEGDAIVNVEAALLDQIYTSLRDISEMRRVDFDGLAVGWRLASTEVGAEPAAVVVVGTFGGAW